MLKQTVKHLAGIIPLVSTRTDFNLDLEDCLLPIMPGYTLLDLAAYNLVCAGCKTIWVVARPDVSPLVRLHLGEWIEDPKPNVLKFHRVPINYVPIPIRDYDVNDSLGWAALVGARMANHVTSKIYSWSKPDAFMVCFPHGVVSPLYMAELRPVVQKSYVHTKVHGLPLLTSSGQSILNDKLLPILLNQMDIAKLKRFHYDENRLIRPTVLNGQVFFFRYFGKDYERKRMDECSTPLIDFFQDIFYPARKEVEVSWFHQVDSWEAYRKFLSSAAATEIESCAEQMRWCLPVPDSRYDSIRDLTSSPT